jgi:hypothetical protein
MTHLLICGAAGFTNRGDDAILWGMLTQLRARFGERPIEVVGGPELAALCKPFGAQARRYDDRSELARSRTELAIRGAALRPRYDVNLARHRSPDRQWLWSGEAGGGSGWRATGVSAAWALGAQEQGGAAARDQESMQAIACATASADLLALRCR